LSVWKPTTGPAPDAILIVPPTAFSGEWSDRPTSEVAIGLRLFSEESVQVGRTEAARFAADLLVDDEGNVRDYDAYFAAYDDALLRHLVARAMCDVNDRTQPHPLFPAAEDQVRRAFTPEGARMVWEAVERLHIERSPARPALSDDEITRLVALLLDDGLRRLTPNGQARARKLLGAVLEDVQAAETIAHEPPPG